MFDWFSWDAVTSMYVTGWQYSILFFLTVSFIFACVRWGMCVSQYIKTGEIDSLDHTWFFVKNNWFHGDRASYWYGNHPGVIAVDTVWTCIASFLLTTIWPVSVIVFTVVAYAKIARSRVVRKETFINNLKDSGMPGAV